MPDNPPIPDDAEPTPQRITNEQVRAMDKLLATPYDHSEVPHDDAESEAERALLFKLLPPDDDDAAGWKEAALRRGEEYNRLADQITEAWAERDELRERVDAARRFIERLDQLDSVAVKQLRSLLDSTPS